MRAAVFSGTGDGREICEYLSKMKISADIYTATEYGKKIMGKMPFADVHTGRMNAEEIEKKIKNADFVIDATHPYAEKITENIKKACQNTKTEYIRMIREENTEGIECDNIYYAKNIKEAVDYLKDKEGNIFVSTGSKEIEKYTEIENYKKRIYARVLDTKEVREKCVSLGFENILYKMPPYTEEENLKDFKGCKYLVTKSSGKTGGFDEKISAAKKLGAEIIIIKRPNNDTGFTIEAVKRLIYEKCKKPKFPLFIDMREKRVLVIGGGEVGCRRIRTLLMFGASVTVISKDIKEKELIKETEYIKKEFEEKDISKEYFMVIGAADSREVNHRIYEKCRELGILHSIADCAEECSFYFPAVCIGDDLSIGIVSDGKNHGKVRKTAEKIRRMIEE